MRKRMIRVFTLIFALVLLLSTVAFAAMNASDYIAATSAGISRNGNTVSVNFYIVGTGPMDYVGLKYIYLYEMNDNIWSLVKTYNYTDPIYAAALMDSNSNAKSGSVSYSGSAGKQYYASCWFYAEKNGGSDTVQQNAY